MQEKTLGERVIPSAPSTTASAEARAQYILGKYEDLAADVNQWKINFTAAVMQNGEVDVVASMGNGTGVRRILSQADVAEWQGDTQTLASELAEKALLKLLKDQCFKELAPKLDAAIRNAVKMSQGSSL